MGALGGMALVFVAVVALLIVCIVLLAQDNELHIDDESAKQDVVALGGPAAATDERLATGVESPTQNMGLWLRNNLFNTFRQEFPSASTGGLLRFSGLEEENMREIFGMRIKLTYNREPTSETTRQAMVNWENRTLVLKPYVDNQATVYEFVNVDPQNSASRRVGLAIVDSPTDAANFSRQYVDPRNPNARLSLEQVLANNGQGLVFVDGDTNAKFFRIQGRFVADPPQDRASEQRGEVATAVWLRYQPQSNTLPPGQPTWTVTRQNTVTLSSTSQDPQYLLPSSGPVVSDPPPSFPFENPLAVFGVTVTGYKPCPCRDGTSDVFCTASATNPVRCDADPARPESIVQRSLLRSAQVASGCCRTGYTSNIDDYSMIKACRDILGTNTCGTNACTEIIGAACSDGTGLGWQGRRCGDWMVACSQQAGLLNEKMLRWCNGTPDRDGAQPGMRMPSYCTAKRVLEGEERCTPEEEELATAVSSSVCNCWDERGVQVYFQDFPEEFRPALEGRLECLYPPCKTGISVLDPEGGIEVDNTTGNPGLRVRENLDTAACPSNCMIANVLNANRTRINGNLTIISACCIDNRDDIRDEDTRETCRVVLEDTSRLSETALVLIVAGAVAVAVAIVVAVTVVVLRKKKTQAKLRRRAQGRRVMRRRVVAPAR